MGEVFQILAEQRVQKGGFAYIAAADERYLGGLRGWELHEFSTREEESDVFLEVGRCMFELSFVRGG